MSLQWQLSRTVPEDTLCLGQVLLRPQNLYRQLGDRFESALAGFLLSFGGQPEANRALAGRCAPADGINGCCLRQTGESKGKTHPDARYAL